MFPPRECFPGVDVVCSLGRMLRGFFEVVGSRSRHELWECTRVFLFQGVELVWGLSRVPGLMCGNPWRVM